VQESSDCKPAIQIPRGVRGEFAACISRFRSVHAPPARSTPGSPGTKGTSTPDFFGNRFLARVLPHSGLEVTRTSFGFQVDKAELQDAELRPGRGRSSGVVGSLYSAHPNRKRPSNA